MDHRLGYGEFCGRILRSRSVSGFSLTETSYAPQARVAPHSHESGYICLVRHGSYNETYGRKARTCRPLTLAFHPPHEIHSESFHDSHVLSFNIELGPSWLERVGRFSKVLESPAEFQGGKVAGLALRLYNEFRLMDDLSPLAIEGLALEMIAEASRARLEAAQPNSPPAWIEQTRAILHAHFNESLPIGRLAGSVGVHPVYLSTVFRAHYRCSIAEYLRRLRVEHACREIIKPDAQLADIALSSGFSHQSHFTRTFKRITGLTPGQYRTLFLQP